MKKDSRATCEFAQMFARYGARVTVVQRADELDPAEEPELSAAVAEGFAADGITVLTGVSCVAVEGTAGDIPRRLRRRHTAAGHPSSGRDWADPQQRPARP